jgi:hypothetical protein
MLIKTAIDAAIIHQTQDKLSLNRHPVLSLCHAASRNNETRNTMTKIIEKPASTNLMNCSIADKLLNYFVRAILPQD